MSSKVVFTCALAEIHRGAPIQQIIADWLKKLGLSEYAERFAENGIDVSVLPHLTDNDLKDMASCSAIDARCSRQLAS
jgi:hypothetical protein